MRTIDELQAYKAKALAYETAIRETLDENAHLADGDDCTLVKLNRVLSANGGLTMPKTDSTTKNAASEGASALPCSARRWDRAQLNDAASAACLALGLEPAEHYDLWSDIRWALVKHDAEKSRQNAGHLNEEERR